MTTKTYRNGSGDWTLECIYYPSGFRAFAQLNDVNLQSDDHDDDYDAIAQIKEMCDQHYEKQSTDLFQQLGNILSNK